jgi:hypothetical protein
VGRCCGSTRADGATVTGREVRALLGLWWHVNAGLVRVGRRGERVNWLIALREGDSGENLT